MLMLLSLRQFVLLVLVVLIRQGVVCERMPGVATTVASCPITDECRDVSVVLGEKKGLGSFVGEHCVCVETLRILSPTNNSFHFKDPIVVASGWDITGSVWIDIDGDFSNSTIVIGAHVVLGSINTHISPNSSVQKLELKGIEFVGDVFNFEVEGNVTTISVAPNCTSELIIGNRLSVTGDGFVEGFFLGRVTRIGLYEWDESTVAVRLTAVIRNFELNSPITQAQCSEESNPFRCVLSYLEAYGSIQALCRTQCTFNFFRAKRWLASSYHNFTSLNETSLTMEYNVDASYGTASPFHFNTPGASKISFVGVREFQRVQNGGNNYQNIIDVDSAFPTNFEITVPPFITNTMQSSTLPFGPCNGRGTPTDSNDSPCECWPQSQGTFCNPVLFGVLTVYAFDRTTNSAYNLGHLNQIKLDDATIGYVYSAGNVLLRSLKDETGMTYWEFLHISDEGDLLGVVGRTGRTFSPETAPVYFQSFNRNFIREMFRINPNHIFSFGTYTQPACNHIPFEFTNSIGTGQANISNFITYPEPPYFQGGLVPSTTTTFTTTTTTTTLTTTLTTTTTTPSFTTSFFTRTTTTTTSLTFNESSGSAAQEESIIIALVVGILLVIIVVGVVAKIIVDRRSRKRREEDDAARGSEDNGLNDVYVDTNDGKGIILRNVGNARVIVINQQDLSSTTTTNNNGNQGVLEPLAVHFDENEDNDNNRMRDAESSFGGRLHLEDDFNPRSDSLPTADDFVNALHDNDARRFKEKYHQILSLYDVDEENGHDLLMASNSNNPFLCPIDSFDDDDDDGDNAPNISKNTRTTSPTLEITTTNSGGGDGETDVENGCRALLFSLSIRNGIGLFCIGTIVGFGSALTGSSGPVLLLPILLALRWDILMSLGCSQVIQIPIALAAVAAYAIGRPEVIDYEIGCVLAGCLVPFLLVGAHFAHKLKSHILKLVVAVLLVIGSVGLLTQFILSETRKDSSQQ
eukprot:m.103973 g.103973  ORF g.103973 m.103973 type:complete len:973 (-) comp12627_c0_seq5:135-3053(-)